MRGMLLVETTAKIRRDHIVDKKAIKAIARDWGLPRNTVRKVLRFGKLFSPTSGRISRIRSWVRILRSWNTSGGERETQPA